MADEVIKVIRIETGGSEQTVKGLKDEINSLRDALLNTEKGSEEYKSILEQLIEDQKKLTDVMRAGQNEAKAAEGSYNSLVNKMAALKKVWRETTDEVSRKEIGNQIKDINDKLKGMDASIGNFQRNVGNYSGAITDSFASMGGAAKGMIGPLNGVKKAFDTLKAHPLIGVLTALAALLINGISKGFKASEEATNKVNVAFSGLKAIGDVITKVFEKVALWIAKVTEKLVAFLEKLGFISPELKKSMEARRKITEDEIKLEDKQRDNIKKNAQLEADAAKLRADAADKSKYTAQERLKFLEEAELKEQEIAKNELEALQLEHDIAYAKLQIRKDDAELKQAEAEASAKLLAAQTAYDQKRMSSAKAVNKVRQEMARDARNAENELLNLQKELIQQEYDLAVDGSEDQLRLAKELRKKELEIQQAGFKEKIKNRKDYDKAMKMAQEAYNRDIAQLERDYEYKRIESEYEYSKLSLSAYRKNSSQYWNAALNIEEDHLNKLNDQLIKETDEKTKKQLESQVVTVKEGINNIKDALTQATENETEVVNQIILESTRPMSAYYKQQLSNLNKYYGEMIEDISTYQNKTISENEKVFNHMLRSESIEQFIQRMQAVGESIINTTIKARSAQLEELELVDILLDAQNKTVKGTFDALTDELSVFENRYRHTIGTIQEVVENDIARISETLMKKASEQQENGNEYTILGGLLPTKENIRKIIENFDFNIKEFKGLMEEMVRNGLIPEDLINEYIQSLQGMVDAEQSIIDEHIDTWNGFHDAIEGVMSGVADIYEQDIRAQVKYNKMSVEQAEKEFENVKALRIAMAVIDTIQGSIAAFMGWQDKGQPWGAIIGAVQAAAVTAAGIAQIAQIQQTEFGSAGNASSVSSAAMAQVTPVMVDYTPQVTTNMTGQQEAEDLANAITSKPIRAYVVESDITNAQELTAQRNSESTF